MNEPITTIIVWLSPVMAGALAWFIVDMIAEVKSSIKDVDTTVKIISKELNETQKSVVRIETDLVHVFENMNENKKYNDNFERKVVSVLRETKKRYE